MTQIETKHIRTDGGTQARAAKPKQASLFEGHHHQLGTLAARQARQASQRPGTVPCPVLGGDGSGVASVTIGPHHS